MTDKALIEAAYREDAKRYVAMDLDVFYAAAPYGPAARVEEVEKLIMTGKLIVLEGIDGSGKSTQAGLLCEWLQDRLVGSSLRRDHRAILTAEPTDATPSGSALREALASRVAPPWPPEVWTSMFIADRVLHTRNTIRPALDAGMWVVCDRYALSTLVYQHFVRGASRKWITATMVEGDGHITPALTIFLDVPVDVALQRIAARGGESVYERREDLEQARSGYIHELTDSLQHRPYGLVYVVDGVGAEGEVAKRVQAAVDSAIR